MKRRQMMILVGLVGRLENRPTVHNLNETSRSSSNVETSEFDFRPMERGEQDNPYGKHFQMICQEVNNMIQLSQIIQFIIFRFYGDDKTLKGRFQTSFYSGLSSILNIRGLNI